MIKIGDIVRLKSGGPCMTVQQFKDKSINDVKHGNGHGLNLET